MKKFQCILLVVVMAIIVVSCRSTAPTPLIPLVQKNTLTKEQIKELETSEADSAMKAYFQSMRADSLSMAKQPKITNVFVETDVRSALTDISTQANVNIIPDATVEGNISVNLEKVPLERALKMVLFPGGYSFRYIKDGNYYLVGKSLPENYSFEALTVTKTVKTNRSAEKVLMQLSDYYKPFIQSGKDGNVMTINGPQDIVSRIEHDISLIDASRRQIEVSAKFVVVQWEKGSNLGMQWGDINLDATGIANLIKGASDAISSNFSGALSNVLQTSGYKTSVNIVAEPRIVVEDGSEGQLKITEEHMFQILAGGGTAYNYFTTKEVSVGIVLAVTPNVTRDGMIRLALQPELSDIVGETTFKNAGSNQTLPIIARRSTNTIIKVDNDQPVAIGGLVMKSKKVTSSGIPLMSSLPIVGKMVFGNKGKAQKDQELVIFITARIIR
jgi:Type II secretory pathway, component HofQ